MAVNFDPIFPSLDGFLDIVVIDPDGTPNRVLEIGKPWTVEIHWRLTGTGASAIGGNWDVMLSLEHVGGVTDEGTLANANKPLANVEPGSTPTNRKFKHSFTVPGTKPSAEGVYRLVTLITYDDMTGNPAPMAGYTEEPLISFYKSEP